VKHWYVWRSVAGEQPAVAAECFGTEADARDWVEALNNHPASGRYRYWVD